MFAIHKAFFVAFVRFVPFTGMLGRQFCLTFFCFFLLLVDGIITRDGGKMNRVFVILYSASSFFPHFIVLSPHASPYLTHSSFLFFLIFSLLPRISYYSNHSPSHT